LQTTRLKDSVNCVGTRREVYGCMCLSVISCEAKRWRR